MQEKQRNQKYLNKYDLILLDERVNLGKAMKDLGGAATLLRKKHFPFPIKITGVDAATVKASLNEIYSTVGMLMGGG